MKKRRELRTIHNSNGLWTNSGYAVFQQMLLSRLAKDGWSLAQIAFWGLEGSPVYLKDYPNIKIYPKMGDQWGADAMVAHGQDFKAHAVFTMQDIWVLDPNILKQIKVFIPYVPIDKSPVPPGVIDKLRYAYKIISMSKFGQKELEKKGFASTLIVEGTDTNQFKPMDQVQCRKDLGLPQDAFFFGMIAANKENPPRKGFQEAIEAFKLFHDKHPEAAILFLIQQRAPGGFPINEFANHLGVGNRMFYVNDYNSIFNGGPSYTSKIYNAIDVHFHPSQTEGFGLTVIEANACGKPTIVNDTTSMPEMVIDGVTGGICKTGKPRFTNDVSWVYPADVDSLYEQMEKVYKMVKDNRVKVAKDCRDHIVKNYNIDTIVKEQWIPLFIELQEELLKTPELTKDKASITIPIAAR